MSKAKHYFTWILGSFLYPVFMIIPLDWKISSIILPYVGYFAYSESFSYSENNENNENN